MELRLKKAGIADCEKIHQMQIAGFRALLDKYQDFDTNPAAETIERIKQRFQLQINHYFIELNGESIGYVRVNRLGDDVCRLSSLLILPEHRGNGYAQWAIEQIERLNPQARHWVLTTIKQEAKLCHLYEKMGYKPTEVQTNVKEGMDLVDYAK